jgi:hypothetical protein
MRPLLALVVLAAVLAATASASAQVAQDCTFKGPKWAVNRQTGTGYTLNTQGVTCAYGIPWARKLAGLANLKPSYPVKGDPAGWTCNAMAPNKTIAVGACVKGTKRFGWGFQAP